MKKINKLIVMILLIGLTNCHKEDVPNYDLSTFSILVKESSGFVDFHYNATIDQDGKLNIQEEYGVFNFYRESEYQIQSEDVSLIKEKLNKLMSINLSEKYGFHENAPTDMPVTAMKYVAIEKSDSTYWYFPDKNEIPTELDRFMQIVHETILKIDTLRN